MVGSWLEMHLKESETDGLRRQTGLKAARDAATSILPDVARELVLDGANHDFRSCVRDGSGKVVFRASLFLRSGFVSAEA